MTSRTVLAHMLYNEIKKGILTKHNVSDLGTISKTLKRNIKMCDYFASDLLFRLG